MRTIERNKGPLIYKITDPVSAESGTVRYTRIL